MANSPYRRKIQCLYMGNDEWKGGRGFLTNGCRISRWFSKKFDVMKQYKGHDVCWIRYVYAWNYPTLEHKDVDMLPKVFGHSSPSSRCAISAYRMIWFDITGCLKSIARLKGSKANEKKKLSSITQLRRLYPILVKDFERRYKISRNAAARAQKAADYIQNVKFNEQN